jgi:hypothetical protein
MNTPLLIICLALVLVILASFSLPLLSRRRRHHSRGRLPEGRVMRKPSAHGVHPPKKIELSRSPEWPRVAMEHRLREPACVACGYKGKHLQVHHIKPFHLHPQLELDPHNLITLCEARGRDHHLLLGHLDAWNSYNEHIREDAKHFYKKSASAIRADLHWQKKMQLRP